MAKRRSQPGQGRLSPEAIRMAQWRACGVLTLIVVFVAVAVSVAVRFVRDQPVAEDDHPHAAAPHGGVIVPLGDEDNHYHVEALRETGGVLRLYLLDADAAKVREIQLQMPTAHVRREKGAGDATILLMPVPQLGDTKGKTSQFFGKLPPALWGERLVVHVSDLTVAGKKVSFDFTAPGDPEGNETALAARIDQQEKFFRMPGGKYTEADVRANEDRSAFEKYRSFQPKHDLKPRFGDRLCPVTNTKATLDCTWVVAGATYAFCCPPCVEEFIKWAKQRPEVIQPPATYLKK